MSSVEGMQGTVHVRVMREGGLTRGLKDGSPSSLVRTAAPFANQPMRGSSSDATRPAMAVWTTTSFSPL